MRGPVSAAPTGTRRVVRAPNHLGDLVMALPGLVADSSLVVVRAWLAPILEMAGLAGRSILLDSGPHGWARCVRALRGARCREGVLLTPSFSAAWLLRWGGVAHLRGTPTDGRGWLLSDRVALRSLAGLHRIDRYRVLLGQDLAGPPPRPTLPWSEDRQEEWRKRLGAAPSAVGIFPGTHAPARRWPQERFVEVGRALALEGWPIVILGGPRDRVLTRWVAANVPGAQDLGGTTDLFGLAALLSGLRLLVTNDTGPMHLAAAVGTPTVSVWGPSDPSETAVPGKEHRVVTGPALPCKPCRRNHCPRSGRGTILPQAREECLRLVDAGRVLDAVHEILEGGSP